MTPAPAETPARRWPLRSVLRTACLVVGLLLGVVGLGDERYVSLQGDMPRHLMNGVFFFDLLRDLPAPADALEYARHYYARYPALSLGHHPFLMGVAEVPAFALFGVSVTSARLVSLAFFLVATIYLFRMATDFYGDPWAGAVAALTFCTSPYLIELTHSVMTELPALALSVVAAYYCHRFAMGGASRDIFAATVLAAAALWAKQLAVVMLPTLIAHVWWHQGWRRLVRRDVIGAVVLSAVIVAPLIPLTLVLSPFNVALATGFASSIGEPGRFDTAIRTLGAASRAQLVPALQVAAVIGLAMAVAKRKAAGFIAALWIVSTLVFVVFVVVGTEMQRYAIYWLPGWALAAGALAAPIAGRARLVTGALAAVVLALQVAEASQIRLPGADGYEAAARLVVEAPRGSTVLFAGDVDTGYFTFFVRKHDRRRQAIVLRADKLLTTSFMGSVAAEDRVSSVDEIRTLLRTFGVGYIVVEDRPSTSRVQNLLLDEVRQHGYVERLRMPFQSTDVRLHGKDLVVYEVTGAGPAAPGARLDIRLPLVSQEIDVAVSDLVARKYLR
jgi:hypothetical protein